MQGAAPPLPTIDLGKKSLGHLVSDYLSITCAKWKFRTYVINLQQNYYILQEIEQLRKYKVRLDDDIDWYKFQM